ncbi:MAG: hypothetical protein ACXW53_04570 [Candidatus Binatia bacterium]
MGTTISFSSIGVPIYVIENLLVVLQKVGRKEIGGVLMAEYVGQNEFYRGKQNI